MVGRALIAAALAACGGRAPDPRTPGETADELGLLAAVDRATCGKQLLWCQAARGWARGVAAPLAAGPQVLVGLTIGLEEGEPVESALEHVTVSVLVWRGAEGARVGRISELQPENDEQKLETSEARMRLEAVFAGSAPSAPLPPKLAADVRTFPLYARYPIERDARGWILRGQAVAELRRVGPLWVVVEVPPKGPRGIFLSVFTERWSAAPSNVVP